MKTIQLVRQVTGDQGTFGKLFTDERGLYTGELPWRDNKNGISCIPIGEYIAKWTYSPGHNRKLYELQDVPDRTNVQIHAGNYCGDTSKLSDNQNPLRSDVEGCILLGLNRESILGQMMLSQSRTAIDQFEKEMAQEDFMLKITEEYV